MRLDRFIKAAEPGRFLRDLMDFFRRCHDELRTPDDYDAYLAQVERREIPLQRVAKSKDAEAMPAEEVLGRCREIARAFRYVEDLLKQEGLGTFGHIITRTVEMLGRRQSVLQAAQKNARFILIDEFQDSNVAQIQLTKLRGENKPMSLRSEIPTRQSIAFAAPPAARSTSSSRPSAPIACSASPCRKTGAPRPHPALRQPGDPLQS